MKALAAISAACISALVLPAVASAQSYPNRHVTIINQTPGEADQTSSAASWASGWLSCGGSRLRCSTSRAPPD